MREIKRALRLLEQHPELDTDQLRALVPKPKVPKLREKLPEPFEYVPSGYQHWLVEHHQLLRMCRGEASAWSMAKLAGVSPTAVLKVERGDLLSNQRVVLKLVTLYSQLLEGVVPEPPAPRGPSFKRVVQDAGLRLFAVLHLEWGQNYEVRRSALWNKYVEEAGNCHYRVQEDANRHRKYRRVIRSIRLLRRSTLFRLLMLRRNGYYLVGARMRGAYDPVGDFLQQRCVREPLAMLRISKFARALHALHPDVGSMELGCQLTRASIWRDATRKYYVGIRLR